MPVSDEQINDPALILVAGPDADLCDRVVADLGATGVRVARANTENGTPEGPASLTVFVDPNASPDSSSAHALRSFAPDAPQLFVVGDAAIETGTLSLASGPTDAVEALSQTPALLCHRALQLLRVDAELRTLREARDRSEALLAAAKAELTKLEERFESAAEDANVQAFLSLGGIANPAAADSEREVTFFAGEQNAIIDSKTLCDRLMHAIDHDKIALHYQPKVDAHSGHILAFEALARWTDEELGAVGPQNFIRVAEDAGLIHKLGDQLLRRACREAKALVDAGLWQGRVAVNVSPIQFLMDDFGDWMLEAIESSGLAPNHVELEITESCLIDHKSAIQVLERMRNQGITIAIDDFGTGYSSLQYLRRLPLDSLKVDRAFVIDIEHDAGAQRLLETVVGLAKGLDLNVVAEGVETSGQWSILRDLGCDEIQGYRVSPAVPPELLASMLQESNPGRTYDEGGSSS